MRSKRLRFTKGFRNTGRRGLKSFVVYTPPAYKPSGARLPRGKPKETPS